MEDVCGGLYGLFEGLEVVRIVGGVPTARFCQMLDIPERSWCHWLARAGGGAVGVGAVAGTVATGPPGGGCGGGVRERAFGSLKYERLYREHIDDALGLVREVEGCRAEFNTVRPRGGLSWNRPAGVQSGRAGPTIPIFPEAEILPTT